MAKSPDPLSALIYPVAERFVDRCLRRDDSLLTPDTPIWSLDTLNDLRERFVDRPDASQASFESNWQHQLAGAPAPTIQLAAELLYVYFLIAQRTKKETRVRQIETVLGWGAAIQQIPDDIWQHSILPYLADHFFDEQERLAEFELETLKASLGLGEQEAEAQPTASDAHD